MNEPTANRDKLGYRVAPGIWVDADGNPHWSIPELLALVELPDTPENREVVTNMLREMMLKHHPDAEIILREKPGT